MSRGNINNEKRVLFGQQASQFVILDCSVSQEITKSVINSLRNVLSLAVNLSGPCRICHFGLCLIGKNISMVFPLQNIRNNSQRLMDTLDKSFDCREYVDMDSTDHTNSSDVFTNKQANLMQALDRIVDQHKQCQLSSSHLGSSAHIYNPCNRNKVEVTIFSCHVRECVRGARGFCRSNSIVGVKRINVVQPRMSKDEDKLVEANSNIRKDVEFDDVSADEGIIELRHLQSNHEVVFEDIFKELLMNNGTDKEHLHIIFPVNTNSETVTIKCDIQECLVNPSSLACASDFFIELDHTPSRALAYSSANKQDGRLVPIYRLSALARVPANSVCDSLIFGPPCLIRPTMCWQLDLEELTRSQNLFQELCRSLLEDDKALILRREGGQSVSGYFLMLPAGDSCLLKSLASRDLLLPRQEGVLLGETSTLISDQINKCLSNLDQLDEYNPVMFESGLYSSCISNLNLSKSSGTRRGHRSQEPVDDSQRGKLSFGYAEKKLHLNIHDKQ